MGKEIKVQKNISSNNTDPAALAFSAVENALKDSILENDSKKSTKEQKSAIDQNAKSGINDREQTAKKIYKKTNTPANEDRLLARSKFYTKIRTSSSSAPLWIATLLSVLWLSLMFFVGWVNWSEQLLNPELLSKLVISNEFLTFLALTILPILSFFAIAILLRRAKDLRLAANSMTEAAIRLSEPEANAAEKIATVSQAVRREVNALEEGLERAVSRAGELEVMVHNEVTSLENTYSNSEIRIRSLIQELAAQREAVVTDSERVRDAITDAHSMMVGEIENTGNSLVSSIIESSNKAKENLNASLTMLDNSLTKKTEDFISLMENKSTDLNAQIENSTERLDEILEERMRALNNSFNDATISFTQTIEQQSQQLNNNLKQTGSFIISELENKGIEIDNNLKSIGEDIAATIDSSAQNAAQELNITSQRLDESLSIRFNNMDSRLNSALIEISSAIDEAAGQTQNLLEQAGTKTLSGIEAKVGEVSLILDSRLNDIDAIIGDKGEKIIISLQDHSKNFNSNADRLESALDEKTSHLNEILSEKSDNLTNAISERTSSIAKTIDGHAQEIRSHTNNAVRSISETMQMRTNDLTKVVSEQVSEINQHVGEQVEQAISRLEDAKSGLSSQIEKAASSVEESANSTANIIQHSVDEARKSIADMVDDRLGTLPEAITARVDITADRLAALNENIHSSISQSMSDLEESATNIEKTIGTSLTKASITISSDVEQTASRMDIAVRTALEEIKEAARHIEDLVEIKALNTAKGLGEKLTEMNEVVVKQSDEFANIIEDNKEKLESSLKSHSNVLLEALAKAAQKSEELMAQSSNKIMSDVNDALKKLNDANLLLQRVLETSSGNLAKLETSIANQTSSYSGAIKNAIEQTGLAGKMMFEHVEALKTSMQSIASEFDRILSDVKSETDNINLATSNLTEAGNSSIEAIKSRQDAMNALIKSFIARSDEIDNKMRGFATSISDVISETEQKIEEANKYLENSLLSSADKVSDKISEFSSVLNERGEDANQLLEKTKQALINDINETLAEAVKRFNETANEMRATASQMGGELEATRTELQRSVMDLPEETRASAAAMRRVVAEQIEALNELNAIVRSQSKPDYSISQQQNRPEENIERAKETRPISESETYQNNINQGDNHQSGSNASLAELLRVANIDSKNNATKTSNKQSNSWLRDVLRNASAKQERAKTNINLARLIDEINKSIDDKALSDAWQRYKNGESNVFSRRLYSLSGQATFDEVRRKIQHDENFAKQANAYIQEFEQFLARAAADKKARNSLIEYLVSDRGKVYTILAHASGRLV